MMEKRIYYIAASVLTAALFVSCTDDMEVKNGNEQQSQNTIQFTVSDTQDWYQVEQDEATTRAIKNGAFDTKTLPTTADAGETELVFSASIINGINSRQVTRQGATTTRGTTYTTMPTTFGIFSYTYANTQLWGSQTPEIYNVETTYDATTQTATPKGGPYYWPDKNTFIRFFAYAPYTSASTSNFQLSGNSDTGSPSITMTVMHDIASQTDLMTAASESYKWSDGQHVMLGFKHNLTCVRFKLGTGMPTNSTIRRIRLTNIANKGTYTIGTGWTVTPVGTSSDDFTITDINMATNGQTNTLITSPSVAATTLLMIPQDFTRDDQAIDLYYTLPGDATEYKVSAKLKNSSWMEGTTITYTLSKKANDIDYTISVASALAGHSGGESFYTVTSYCKSVSGSTKTPIPWKVVGYSTDGTNFTAEKPSEASWFNIINTSGSGSVEGERAYVKFSAQEGKNSSVDNTTQHNLMVANGTRGEGNRYDLSKHDIAGNQTLQNTANCYIVNAPGYYKLPLIYGNGIKNGEKNEAAYLSSTFVDYNGTNITTPNIHTATNVPDDAVLLWQDVNGLVTNVSLDKDNDEIHFDIGASTIDQGNAVIAVRDANDVIMWSWHIWVTGLDVLDTKRLVNYDQNVYHFMPYYLGLCTMNGTMTSYDERSLYVKVQQDGGQIAIFKVQQPASKSFVYSKANAPYYQFGRKDPMLPSNGCTGNNGGTIGNKTTFSDVNRNPTYGSTYTRTTLAGAIRNPNILYGAYNATTNTTNNTRPYLSWLSSDYPDIWCANRSSLTAPVKSYRTVKTIYDPCPAGYHVPETYAFTGLVNSSSSVNVNFTDITNIKKVGDYSNGWYFKTDDEIPSTLYMVGINFRNPAKDHYGAINTTYNSTNISGGGSWTSASWIAASGSYMWLDASAVYLLWQSHASYGLPILPCRDTD